MLQSLETDRFAGVVALAPNEVIAREMLEKWGIQGLWPRDAMLANQSDDFTWIDRQLTRMKGGDNHDVQQGFFIHSEPYVSTDQLRLEYLLDRRDALTRKHVPGPTPGSFMATERRIIPSYEEGTFGLFSMIRGLVGAGGPTALHRHPAHLRAVAPRSPVHPRWKGGPSDDVCLLPRINASDEGPLGMPIRRRGYSSSGRRRRSIVARVEP